MKAEQQQAALEKSNELIEQFTKRKTEDGDIDKLLEDEPQSAAEPEAPAEGNGDEQGESPLAPEPEPEPPKEPPHNGLQQRYDELKSQYDRLEHTHKVLRGKYDAEIPSLHQRIRELEQAKVEPDSSIDEVRSQLMDEFPEGTVKALESLARAYAKNNDVQALQEKLASLEGKTREQQLQALIPDWRQIQQNSQWVPYLQERNPESGLERNDHLQEAYQRGDMQRVKAIFDGFRARIQSPAKVDAPPTEPQSRTNAPRTEARRQFRRSEVDAFYRKLRANELNVRDPKVQALRDRIEEAVADGRVV